MYISFLTKYRITISSTRIRRNTPYIFHASCAFQVWSLACIKPIRITDRRTRKGARFFYFPANSFFSPTRDNHRRVCVSLFDQVPFLYWTELPYVCEVVKNKATCCTRLNLSIHMNIILLYITRMNVRAILYIRYTWDVDDILYRLLVYINIIHKREDEERKERFMPHFYYDTLYNLSSRCKKQPNKL